MHPDGFTFYTINVMWLHAFLTLWFEWSNLKSVVLFCSENPRCILIPDVNRATTMCTVQLYILNGSTTKSILSQLSSQVWPLWKVIMDHLSKNHLNMLYYCHYLTGGICLLVVNTESFIFCDNNFALASLFILRFNQRIVQGAVG